MDKRYDLNITRPKVLFLGNGILRTNANVRTWKEVIEDLAESEERAQAGANIKSAPYSTLADICLAYEDKVRRKKYDDYFNGTYKCFENDLLNKLVKLDFDAIITTNYTYEIENVFKANYSRLNANAKRKYAICTSREKKDMLRTYNNFRVSGEKEKSIWHIHGEVRNKSSIVLTHDEYSRKLAKIINYFKSRGNEFAKYYSDFKIKSWADYFIVSDLYMVGFGFDFSEIDLWWLLNRRRRERNCNVGEINCFCPLSHNEKIKDIINALEIYDVKVKSCGVKLTNDEEKNKKLYVEFYTKAISEIEELLKRSREI